MSIYREDEFLRETIKKISVKYGITYYQAYDIYHSRFALIRENLDKLDVSQKIFPTVGVPHLGKFAIKTMRRRRLLEKYKYYEDNYKPKNKKNGEESNKE